MMTVLMQPHIVADVIGVIVCTLFNIAPIRAKSAWTGHVEAFRAGNGIIVTGAVLLAAQLFLFRQLYWTAGVSGEYYVPDSAPHSILFALSVLGAMAGSHFLLLPTVPSR
jgi:hypothetical protein